MLHEHKALTLAVQHELLLYVGIWGFSFPFKILKKYSLPSMLGIWVCSDPDLLSGSGSRDLSASSESGSGTDPALTSLRNSCEKPYKIIFHIHICSIIIGFKNSPTGAEING